MNTPFNREVATKLLLYRFDHVQPIGSLVRFKVGFHNGLIWELESLSARENVASFVGKKGPRILHQTTGVFACQKIVCVHHCSIECFLTELDLLCNSISFGHGHEKLFASTISWSHFQDPNANLFGE